VAGQGRQSDERGSAHQRLPQRRTQRHPRNQPGCTCNPGTLVRIKHRGPLHEESSAPRRGLDCRATPSGCLVAAVVTVALAALPSPSQPWLPSRKRRPTAGGSACPGGPPSWSWRSRMSECLPCRSSVPCPHRFRFGWRAEWRGRCPAGCDRAGGVRKAVRSWRPLWTPDTTAWTLDGDQACGRSGIEHGCSWSRRTALDAGNCCGWPKASMCIFVLSGQGQDGRAAWLAVAGWPGAWLDAGRCRCPPLGRRCPDRVRTHRLAGHLELGCPADRTVERSAMSVARPATAGCPQEKLVGGGDGVQAGVRRPHPGGSGRPAGLRACPARHGRRSSRCPLGGPGLVRGPTSGSGAETYFRHRSGDGRLWGEVVSGYR
jgi:hypothetical protein